MSNCNTPLYRNLANKIRKDIASGKIAPGSKLPSENELANKYGMSRLTARQAVTVLVNEGLVERHHGKGSYCKNVCCGKKIDVLLDMSDYYFIPYYMQSISKVLNKSGATFIAADTKNQYREVARLIRDIAARGSDGIILLASPEKDYNKEEIAGIFDTLSQKNIPCIQIDTWYDVAGVPRVIMNEEKMGQLAAEHFEKMGHKKIALIYYENNILSDMRMKPFYEMFEDVTEINYNSPCFKELLLKAHSNGVTGVFCYSDFMAIRLLDALKSLNLKMPEDISVITVDDTPVSQMYYITSAVHAKEKIGEYAAKCIVSGNLPKEKIFEPGLSVRKSVADINQ